jgi:transposase-like protein
LTKKKGAFMPRKKHSAEQIISALRQMEVEQSKGRSVEEVCRELQITSFTYYRWRKQYGGLKMDQAKRLKELEKENTQLKRVVADISLDNRILKDLARGNS